MPELRWSVPASRGSLSIHEVRTKQTSHWSDQSLRLRALRICGAPPCLAARTPCAPRAPPTSGQQPPPPTHSEQTLRRSYLRQSLDQKNLLSIAILSIENEILNSRFKMILMSSVSIKAKRVQFQIVWYK